MATSGRPHIERCCKGGFKIKMAQEKTEPKKKRMEDGPLGPLDHNVVRMAHTHGCTPTLELTPTLGLGYFIFFIMFYFISLGLLKLWDIPHWFVSQSNSHD